MKQQAFILSEERIKQIITEELGVAQEVVSLANKIYSEICRLLEEGVNKRVFNVKTGKSDVNVDFFSHTFENVDEYYTWVKNGWPNGYSYKQNTIFLNFISIKNTSSDEDLYDTIQHECEHYWESKNKGAAISTDRYQNIIDGIQNRNPIVNYFCKVFYYCNKHEIDAFVNGAYASAMEKKKKYETYKDFILDNSTRELYFTLKNFRRHLLKYDYNNLLFAAAMGFLSKKKIFYIGNNLEKSLEKLEKYVTKYYNYLIRQIGKVYSLYCIKMKELDDAETRFRANEILRKPFGDREEFK